MRIECPLCRNSVVLDRQPAGSMLRCPSCRKSFVAPQGVEVSGQDHNLTAFPTVQVLLLHYATAGLFTLIYLNLMHDKLPRIRRSDPSGFVAVALACIPGVNLIWFFFTYRRLCIRINEQRRFRGMSETAPQTLAGIVATVLLCGVAGLFLPATGWAVLGATYAVLFPVFIAMMQTAVNELVADEPVSTPLPA